MYSWEICAPAAPPLQRRPSRAAGTAAEVKVEVGVEADTYNIIPLSHTPQLKMASIEYTISIDYYSIVPSLGTLGCR